MKKLMFATALAASAAAFATNGTAINATSFEGYTADGSVLVNKGDSGETGASGNYFCFKDGDADGSLVKTYGGDNLATPPTNTYYYGESGLNYLALETEGGTLWRSINTITGSAGNYDLGTATNVASTGTYLDTLVQFTATEDQGPEDSLTSDDKLAIWLQVDSNNNTTNLMVRAAYVDDNGTATSALPTNYVLATASPVVAGTWYRLTVKAIADVTKCKAKNGEANPNGITGFEIYLDGVQLLATSATIGDGYIDRATDGSAYGWLDPSADADFITYLQSGKVFPSLKGETSEDLVQGVGFKGSGALDEIVWTTDDPFPVPTPPLTFTLTWDPTMVSAVSYVLSADDSVTNALTSGTAVQIAAGTTGTVELIPTFQEGYEFDHLQIGDVSWEYLTFDVPNVSTNGTLVAKASAPAYPSYLDTADATIKGKYDAWKQAVGFDDSTASSHEKQFLLNVDEETVVGDAALEIISITQNATAGWDITIGCSISGVGLTGTAGSAIVCNGYLAVSYTDDLTGTWTTENINITSVDATAGTVTVNVNKSGAKFMKVKLSSAAEPQN